MFVVGGQPLADRRRSAPTCSASATEMLGVLVTGEIWLGAADDLLEWTGLRRRVREDGCLPLRPLRHGRRAVPLQYGGPAIAGLGMQERMTPRT
jgi:hypothetical protein